MSFTRPTVVITHRHQGGRSLMELMIAMVIGFIILGSIMLMTSNSNYGGQQSGTQSRLDEDAQLVLSVLGPQIRMAGYSAVFNDRTDGVAYKRFMGAGIRGCDNGFANIAADTWRGDASQQHSQILACAAGGDGAAISVMYEADTSNTLPNADGEPTDCLGRGVDPVTSSLQAQSPTTPAASKVTVVENRFFIRKEGNTLTLSCAGNGVGDGSSAPFDNPQPLISNIETLQVRYGVSAAAVPLQSATGINQYGNQVVGYVTASELDQQFNATTDPDNDRWMRVVNVKLCVTVRSEKPEAGSVTAYVNCDGQVVTPSDKYLRRTAQATFALRNRSGIF
jgi:type IV pilus assembly protein PilW